jgi:hypothetical protein
MLAISWCDLKGRKILGWAGKGLLGKLSWQFHCHGQVSVSNSALRAMYYCIALYTSITKEICPQVDNPLRGHVYRLTTMQAFEYVMMVCVLIK